MRDLLCNLSIVSVFVLNSMLVAFQNAFVSSSSSSSSIVVRWLRCTRLNGTEHHTIIYSHLCSQKCEVKQHFIELNQTCSCSQFDVCFLDQIRRLNRFETKATFFCVCHLCLCVISFKCFSCFCLLFFFYICNELAHQQAGMQAGARCSHGMWQFIYDSNKYRFVIQKTLINNNQQHRGFVCKPQSK